MQASKIYKRGPRLALAGLLLAAGQGFTAPVIPEQGGWSGEVTFGAGAGSAEINMIDGVGGIQIGDDRVDGLDEDAGSEGFGFPVLSFDVGYTLADTGTQFYLAYLPGQPAPHIFLDLEAHAGLRQRLPDVGVIDVSLSGSAPVTKVWKDPYLTGANRGDTERSVTGMTFQWHNVMETPLSLGVSSRDIDIDDEESGASLALSSAERRLLRRTGEVYRYHARYDWVLGDRHTLTPGISYLDYQLDGDAMAEDGLDLALQYEYHGVRWQFAASLYYRDLEADANNPIFADYADREVLGAALSVQYPEPFGWEKWTASARVGWYDSDSDVDFYDENLSVFMLGATYRIE